MKYLFTDNPNFMTKRFVRVENYTVQKKLFDDELGTILDHELIKIRLLPEKK